ncbi:MFS transporter [Paraburkholderia hospita]|uniref:MFS transporter n=1 Tax=Paraburkholderia hospita TaxID=169430 RepID=A0AAN1JKG8_9BURK|nr:MFS transporter [Paraburkholderia hospita]AUT74958.1 MFS transporter [Paraburkholderia hospita]EIM94889.1 major facilitator superfamily protein [Paraburkholderia hospita]OUL77577.1 MFS transporter [Paraburkholderia hospita]OUL91983.1 MFS transporter [Paraburkholderia hospita]SEH70587.1 Sugar phosphate permease [Paraburkholderia hospita]
MDTTSIDHRVEQLHRVATHKAMLRLIPLMCAIYFMSFLDRTNVALAKIQLAADVGISAAAYGFGSGIFFLGYALLEVPSNLAAHRVGPRRWIARIAVTWGILSTAMMFVQGTSSFYVLRVLLGIAEAGLFPALMYMVTLWFAPHDRPVVVGWIYIAPALALMLGSPLGGALMQLDGFGGLHGWQWMFMIEGIPSVIVGIVLFFAMPERPRDARWLSAAERDVLETHAVIDVHGSAEYSSANWIAALKRPTTVLIGLIYFLNQVAFVGLYFFAPAIVHQMHVDSPLVIGFLAASVGLGFLLGVLILPRIHRRVNSDCVFLGVLTAGLVVGACVYLAVTTPAARICLLTVTAFFGGGVLPSYWAIAMKRLQGIQAAAGLAFINTIGLIGGFVGPYLFGMAETSSGRSDAGFTVILVAAVLGLALVPLLARAIRGEDRVESSHEPAAQMKS